MMTIAHRGGAQLRPENTLPAFAHAMALGADGAELDVQLSADGVVVVHHDMRLNPGYARDADGRWIGAPGPRIKDLTLAQLQAFDLGRVRPGSAYAIAHPDLVPQDGARLPSLADVIAMVKPKPGFLLQVELKSDLSADSADPVALADAALAVVRQAGFLPRTIFVGFDWRGLVRLRAQEPQARLWFSTDEKIAGDPALFAMIRQAGGAGWFPWFGNLTAERAAQARAEGLALGAWTVDDPAEMARLKAQGIDALCTDRPG
jgi:glycerophosphoryl diester phosphodiesterase